MRHLRRAKSVKNGVEIKQLQSRALEGHETYQWGAKSRPDVEEYKILYRDVMHRTQSGQN